MSEGELRIEWEEDDCRGGLHAASEDGMVYEGTFAYAGWPNDIWHTRLGCYRGPNGAVLLFGDWWRADRGEEGTWLIQLYPPTN